MESPSHEAWPRFLDFQKMIKLMIDKSVLGSKLVAKRGVIEGLSRQQLDSWEFRKTTVVAWVLLFTFRRRMT